MIPVLILAGGLATRLHPVTQSLPKALIEIGGKPFIFHQLNYLKHQGVDKVFIAVGYMGEMIQKAVGDGGRFGLNVSYIEDGPILLGTGGAVKKAMGIIESPFFVQYGDSFLPINYKSVEDAFYAGKQIALMTVLKNENKWDRSNVVYQNHKIIEYNKLEVNGNMNYIDYGLGVLTAHIFGGYPSDVFFDLAEVYNDLSKKQLLDGYEAHDRFYEIGSFDGIKEAEYFFSQLLN